MSEPLHISREDLSAGSHITWNAFVGFLASANYENLTEIQRAAFLVFCYESEVQNGGHMQYFENLGLNRLAETANALRTMHAECFADVLVNASRQRSSRNRVPIQSSAEYALQAQQEELSEFDSSFHKCKTELIKLLEQFMKKNLDSFIRIVD